MKTVRQLLEAKGGRVVSVKSSSSVYDALKVMADCDIGAVLVIDEGRLVGVMSERDYARKVVLMGKSSPETAVREIMTTRIVSVHPRQTVPDCMTLMTANRVRHLPVIEEDRIVGVLSIGDLVKETIREQERIIADLQNYIRG